MRFRGPNADPSRNSPQVPYDQPLAAHDMFLRFVGASLLSAAGPAAQVPSRIGNEIPAVLGSTRPDGSSLNATLADGTSMLDASSGAGDDSTLIGSGDSKLSSSSGSESSASSDGWWSPLSGSAVEGVAHASSAIVLVLLMVAALGGFLYIRKRNGIATSGGGGGRRRRNGKGWASLTPRGKQHERAQSLGRGGGLGMGGITEDEDGFLSGEANDTETGQEDRRRRRRGGGVEGAAAEGEEEEEAHELDELMRSSHARSRRRLFDADDEEQKASSSGHHHRRGELDEEAKVFGLGDAEEEDDDDDSEGGGGDDADTIADREGRRNWRRD